MDQKTLAVVLKFGLDNEKAAAARKELERISARFLELKRIADESRKALAEATDKGINAEGLKNTLTEVEAEMGKVAAEARVAQAALTEALKTPADQAKETVASLTKVKDASEKLGAISLRVAAVGAGILATYNQLAQSYVDKAGKMSDAGQAWLATSRSLEQSQLRLGQVATAALNPLRDKLAEVLEQVADIAERSPGAAKAIAVLGVGLTGAGGLGSLAAQGLRVYADVQLLAAAALQKQAAGEMLAAAGIQAGAAKAGGVGSLATLGKTALASVPGAATLGGGALAGAGALGVYGASAVGGAFIGKEIGNYVNRLLGQQEQSWGDILTTAQQLGAMLSPLGMFSQGLKTLGFDEPAAKLWGLTKTLYGLGEAADQTGKKTDAASGFAQENVQLFLDFEKQKAEAASQYADQVKDLEADAQKDRLEIVRDFARQAAEAEADYGQQRAKAFRSFETANAEAQRSYQQNQARQMADFALTEARAENDYYRNRTNAARSYGIEVARMEADHQLERLRAQEDHNSRVDDLVAAGDALGLKRENRTYERDRQRAEGDFGLEAERKNQDYARQLADLEANFAQARAQRRDDFARQQAENAAQYREQRAQRAQEFAAQQQERAQEHAQEMARLKQAEAEKLKALETSRQEQLEQLRTAYDRQARLMQTAFVDRLNTLTGSIQGSTAKYQQWMLENARRFDAELSKLGFGNPTTPPPGTRRAAGGYASFGQYTLGDSPSGGPGPDEFVLSGQTTRLLENALGGRLSQQNITSLANHRTYQINVPISGVSGAEAASLRRVVRETVDAVLLHALPND